MPVVWMQVAATLGYAHLLGGRHAEGLSLLEEAEEQAGTLQFMYIRALAIAWLAEAHLLAGRRDEAKRHARRALMVARAQKARGDEAWSHRLQAEIAFREGPRRWAESESAYLRALALADELGMRPLAARCHLGLGHLCRRAGKPTTAERHFARARALCRRLEMDQRLALRGVSRSIGHKRR